MATHRGAAPSSLLRRWTWFAALWAGGVLAAVLVAAILKLAFRAIFSGSP